MASAPRNPYRPGRGVLPPVLAGREAELDRAEARLGTLTAGATASQDLLYYGPRGNGKTTLLIRIRERAGELGMRVGELPVEALRETGRLVEALQERAGVLHDRLSGVSIAGVGATAERAAPTREVSALLRGWIGADSTPLVIVLDEVNAVVPEVGRAFFDAVQDAKREATPFLLVAAGTPDAPRRLREAGTHNERGFERVRVGRLRREDTVTALAEPAGRSGWPMSDEAAALLAKESQDYPYFVQLLGSAAWDAASRAGGSGIGVETARKGFAEARGTLEDFYGERFDEAADAGLAGVLRRVASLFTARGGQVGDGELAACLDSALAEEPLPDFDSPGLRGALRELGVVWQTSPGVWEMGIPSFAAHVLRRTAPPGVGYSGRRQGNQP